MFSDSGAPPPGEQRGLKPHGPHFTHWLRGSLRPRRGGGGDPGPDAPRKSSPEGRNNPSQPERAKGVGFFSARGRERAKKGELRRHRAGMARMLPAVLRGHHILPGGPGKRREDSPPRWDWSPELRRDAAVEAGPGDRPQGLTNSPVSELDSHTFVRNRSNQLNLLQSRSDGTSTFISMCGPLVGPPPTPVLDGANCRASGAGDKRGKVCDHVGSATCRQRDLRLSKWLNSDAQGLTERTHGFTSGFSYVEHKSRISKSHRDLAALREPPVEASNGPLSGVIVSAEAPRTGPGHAATPPGSGKPGPSSEGTVMLGQSQTRVRCSPASDGGRRRRREAGCTMRVVRNQIKLVVDNLEQVLRALRDVHQEMKEVVLQIDHLTSFMELNEEELWTAPGADSSSSPNTSSTSRATVASVHRGGIKPEQQPGAADSPETLRRDRHGRRQSPPDVLLHPLTSWPPLGRTQSTQCTTNPGFSSPQGLRLQHGDDLTSPNPSQGRGPASHDLTLSPQTSLPVRPPTPGLSPLTVSLHRANSPASRPRSPGPPAPIELSPPSPVSPKPQPPPAFSSCRTPRGDHPSAGQFSPSSTQPPSASRPPTDSEAETVCSGDKEWRASTAGPTHRPPQVSAVPAATARPPTGRGRGGRRPPPYPHGEPPGHRKKGTEAREPPPYPDNKPPEHAKKVKEPREAPPYPEKRRPLSTTV